MNIIKRGFTLIEVMKVIAMIGIIVAIAAGPAPEKPQNSVKTHSGLVQQQCLNGYAHTINSSGAIQQTINENGGGIKCE